MAVVEHVVLRPKRSEFKLCSVGCRFSGNQSIMEEVHSADCPNNPTPGEEHIYRVKFQAPIEDKCVDEHFEPEDISGRLVLSDLSKTVRTLMQDIADETEHFISTIEKAAEKGAARLAKRWAQIEKALKDEEAKSSKKKS